MQAASPALRPTTVVAVAAWGPPQAVQAETAVVVQEALLAPQEPSTLVAVEVAARLPVPLVVPASSSFVTRYKEKRNDIPQRSRGTH